MRYPEGHFRLKQIILSLFIVCFNNLSYGQVPLPTHDSVVPYTQGQGTLPSTGGGTVGVPLPPHDPIIVPLSGGTSAPVAPYIPVGNNGGGLNSISNPSTDVGVQQLLKHPNVLHKIQIETKADSAVKISKLISAHKQVVSGQVTYLSLHVVETLCPVGTLDVIPCQQDVTEDPYICEIAVWERPWLNSTKIIDEKTRCEETEDDSDFKSLAHHLAVLPPLSRFARPLQSLPQELNGKQIAVEAFNYIHRGSDSDFEGRMVNYEVTSIMFDPAQNVTRVRMNIEYGFTLCLKPRKKISLIRTCPPDNSRPNYLCSVTVADNPNELMRLHVIPDDDDDIQCIKKNPVDEELVIAVQAPCLGCPQPAPLSDPTVLDILDFAVTEFDRSSTDDDLHIVLKLIKANTQVVSGVKYFLTVELAETDCNKAVTGVDLNRTYCKQDLDEDTKLCDLHVVDQAWIPARDLVYGRCYEKDGYPTGDHDDEFIVPVAILPSSQGPNKPLDLDAFAQVAVNFVIAEYNKREADDIDDAYYKLVKVHESSVKPSIRGQERHLVIELGETNCFPNSASRNLNLNNCSLNPWEEHEVCEVRLLEQSSQNTIHRSLTYMHCDDLDDYLYKKTAKSIQSFSRQNQPFIPQSAASNSAASGVKLLATDPNVLKAAAFVVEQFNLQSDEDEVFVLSHVVSAHSLPDAGTKYLLEIEMAETRCKKYQPVLDASRCPVDYSEEPQVCQAEVMIHSGDTRSLGRLYCDERDDYYIHRIAAKFGTSIPTQSSQGINGPRISQTANWPSIDINSRKLVQLSKFVVDEFDLRSDEDNVYVVSKLHNAKQQVDGGLNFYLTVEIAETVCPKYKQGINKTRCAIDIGEEHKMCEAIVQEQEWLNKRQVLELQCADLDDFYTGDDSREILYPNVHPTAHARPVFLTHLKVKESKESEESNEFRKKNHSFESAESNEKYYFGQNLRTNNQRPLLLFDSDEGHDSDESRHWIRGRRSVPGGHTTVDPSTSKIQELADFALASMDELQSDPRARKVTTVLSASKQVVAGLNWNLKMKITWTTCLKEEQPQDLKSCPIDNNDPEYICDITVWEQSWVPSKKVTQSNCTPVNESSVVA